MSPLMRGPLRCARLLLLLMPMACCTRCSSQAIAPHLLQFMSIIRGAQEDSIKAAYATKVASLVESYAQPAEYAKTMAGVLVAAGNAAPKSLASRIATTLAECGEPQVQADTAKVFARLLRGPEPLSDAQMLVRRSPDAAFSAACTINVGVGVSDMPAHFRFRGVSFTCVPRKQEIASLVDPFC